jgi:glucokinase
MFGLQIGHFVIDTSHDQLCLTGSRGTGEIFCSATALVLAVRSGLQRGIPSALSDDYWRDPHSIDFKAVIERGVALGDRLCLDELRRWTRSLGWLLVNAVHAYSPEVIVLAGGATAASSYFLPELTKQVNQHVFRYPPSEPVPILISELGDHAGVHGAALMVRERLASQKR